MLKVHYTTRDGQETSQTVATVQEARRLAEQTRAWAVEDLSAWTR